MSSAIVFLELVQPIGGAFGVAYTDTPRASDGYEFEALAHGVRISHPNRPGVSVLEPWHRCKRVHEAALPPVVQNVDSPKQEPTARTRPARKPAK